MPPFYRSILYFIFYMTLLYCNIQVHPDKNPEDRERAQAAFDALSKANSLLQDEKTRKKCYEIVEEARGRTGSEDRGQEYQFRQECQPGTFFIKECLGGLIIHPFRPSSMKWLGK